MLNKSLVALITLMFCGSAYAAGEMNVDFQKLDGNGDGYVSKEEAQANPKLIEQWADLDANGDGQLSETEINGGEAQS